MPLPLRAVPAALLVIALSSCSSMYYATMEKFGYQKRDLLVERVEEGREQQVEAKEQFKTTFETFKELTGFSGGDLEALYNRLDKEHGRCKDQAESVSARIASIETVAADMFSEWGQEIEEIANPDIQRKSEALKGDTEKRYDRLIGIMKTAESKMGPVLTAFRDHVLFLKHNLNAKAIASLQDTVLKIETDVSRLVEDMQSSIDEADEFISSMGNE